MPRGLPFLTPSQPTRREALADIRHEMEMFCWLFANESPAEERAKWLWMEGLLLHARNLFEFFRQRPAGETRDTIHAADFGFVGKLTEPQDLWKLISKALAHPSYSRATWRTAQVDSEGKILWDGNWRLPDFEPLLTTTRDFATHVLALSSPEAPPGPEKVKWRALTQCLPQRLQLRVTGTISSMGEPLSRTGGRS